MLNWQRVGEVSRADNVLHRWRNVEVRELHAVDFVSYEDTEDKGDEEYELESDGESIGAIWRRRVGSLIC